MLVVSSSVRMVHGVHSNTTSTGPVVPLGLELVECTASLEQRLVDPSTTSNDTNGSTSRTADSLLGTRGETDAGLVLIRRVSDDGGIVARGTGKGTTVADLLLDVADDGTFGALGDREDVADGESGFLTAVNEGTGVETLGSDEGFLAELVAVGVTEDYASKGSTTE